MKHRWNHNLKGIIEDTGGKLVSVPIFLPEFPLEQIVFVMYSVSVSILFDIQFAHHVYRPFQKQFSDTFSLILTNLMH